MPKQPAKNLVRSPSHSTYWLARNRIVACATVSRTVGSASGVLNAVALETTSRSSRSQGQPWVDVLVFPGAAQPGVFGIVDDLPCPFLAGARHHIQVIHVVPGRRDGRTVVAMRDEDDIAAAHLLEHLDRTVGRAIYTVIAEPTGITWPRVDLEVVDLLQRRLDGSVLVVFVCRVARPVAAGGDHLDRHQRVGLENACGAEVLHLPAAVAGTAKLDRHVGGGHPAVRQLTLGPGSADRETTLTAQGVCVVDADVNHVGRPVENRSTRGQFECLAVGLDGSTAGQRQDHHLGVACLKRELAHRLQFHHLKAALGPASRFGSVVDSITRSISSTTGNFIQVYAEVEPRPCPMWIDLITASADRSLRTLPSTRVDMNGSSIAIRPCDARSSIARAHASSVATVPGSPRSMRHNIFPPFILAAAVAAAVAAVILSSSSNCAPARPPRFIEENTTLSSSAPSSTRSSRMSEVASTPSTPGSASAARSRSSRSVRLFIAVGREPTASAPRAG